VYLAPVALPLGRKIYVGRSPNCEVVVPSIAVERRKGEVQLDEQGVWLTDLDSRSGIWATRHAAPSCSQIVGRTRLEVDDAFFVVDFGFVLTPSFAVPAAWRNWDGGAIWRLAQAAQLGRDWATLPVLADALEEAGCTEEELVRHFREVNHRLGHCAALLRLVEGLCGFRNPGRST
jgi:hypothetical protein